MKSFIYPVLILLITASCNNATAPLQKATGCDLLTDSIILQTADSILEHHEKNTNIWNLSELDSDGFSLTDDHFINAETDSRLVLIHGQAGLSAGCANSLLILFDCQASPSVVWCGQVGIIDTNFQDLNNDGIVDIVAKTETVWMGECNSSYEIFNFKGGKQNTLYSAFSQSLIDCGSDDTLATRYKPGDTLEANYVSSLVKSSRNSFAVKKISTFKIHNGGSNDSELMQHMKIVRDTVIVELK